MKKWIALMALSVSMSIAGPALAHGAKAKHGGIVATANDIQFELVNKDGKPVIYVEDHGQKVATAGATGKLTVLNGRDKTEVTLQPVPENALVANGDVKLAPGAKAIAAVTLAVKQSITVRFAIKK